MAADEKNAVHYEVDELNAYTLMRDFEKSMVNNKVFGAPGTNGSFQSNLWAYIQQEHYILGMLFTNPLDPFTRRERQIFFVNTFSFLFMLAAACSEIGDPMVEAIIIALLIEPYKIILRFIAECPCLYSTSTDAEEPDVNGFDVFMCFSKFIEGCGQGLTGIFSIGTLLWIIVGIIVVVSLDDSVPFVISWCSSQVFSYFGTAMLYILLTVYWSYKNDKTAFYLRYGKFLGPDDIPSYTTLAQKILNNNGGEVPQHQRIDAEQWKLGFMVDNTDLTKCAEEDDWLPTPISEEDLAEASESQSWTKHSTMYYLCCCCCCSCCLPGSIKEQLEDPEASLNKVQKVVNKTTEMTRLPRV